MRPEATATRQRCLTTWQDASSDQTAPVDGTHRCMSAHRPNPALLFSPAWLPLCIVQHCCTGHRPDQVFQCMQLQWPLVVKGCIPETVGPGPATLVRLLLWSESGHRRWGLQMLL
jgi:hypothetical protein